MKRYERQLYEIDDNGNCLAQELIIQKMIDDEKTQQLGLEKILKKNRMNRQDKFK